MLLLIRDEPCNGKDMHFGLRWCLLKSQSCYSPGEGFVINSTHPVGPSLSGNDHFSAEFIKAVSTNGVHSRHPIHVADTTVSSMPKR